MLGAPCVDCILQSKVSRAYLFTERIKVSPNICDDKRGFAKYLRKSPWLLGTSVRKVDGFTPDFFMYLGAVAFLDEGIEKHF
jgi:hypothetical protein